VVRRQGFGYLAKEPSSTIILPLSDKDLSVDDMGAAPPGWYTVEKEIELRTLTSDYTWQFGKRQKKKQTIV
jgi:hypothetical protein